jgi:hypothetical protein
MDDLAKGICIGVGLVVAQESIRMIFPDSRRMGLTLFTLAVVLLSAPITVPFVRSLFRPGSVRIDNYLRAPSPKIFFPTVVFGAAFVGVFSQYWKDAALCGRLNGHAQEIEDFRLERAANASAQPFALSSGAELLASMGRRSQERAAYLWRFKKPLTQIAKEVAAHDLGDEKNLLESFLKPRDLESVEIYLRSLAKVIDGQPKKALLRWSALRTSGALVCFPTVIWIVWAILARA